MNSGKKWVLGLLALGTIGGLIAVNYWRRPENSVRSSFTLIHSFLIRGRKNDAATFLAPRVTWNGRDLSSAEFLAEYTAADPDVIETRPCPAQPTHWTVTMRNRDYCFVGTGSSWRLHALSPAPCPCK